MKWCGKIFSGQTVSHDPERNQGLSVLRRPETAGELLQFLEAINWMRASLPELTELKALLRGLLEECPCNTAHQARGGAPCYRTQRVGGRACGRVGCCATTGERSGASESPKARILCDNVP